MMATGNLRGWYENVFEMAKGGRYHVRVGYVAVLVVLEQARVAASSGAGVNVV
jgi:hypothetical protein